MYENIFNNISAQDFFNGTVLVPKRPLSLKRKCKSILSSLLGVFIGEKPTSYAPLSEQNICFYSDSELIEPFSFAIAAAVAARGLYCAYITPTPQDFSTNLLECLPNAASKDAKNETVKIAHNLYIARSDVPLPPRGFDFAVVSPASAYTSRLHIPHVLISHTRCMRENYRLVHFKTAENSILLSSAAKQFRYYFSRPEGFENTAPDISPQIMQLILEKNLPVRTNSSHAHELAALLSYGDIDGFSIATRPSTSLGVRLANALIPIDLSPLAKEQELSFCIKTTPSF